jgi:RNA polymerase sigma factor (sigma-70 family)
MNKEIEEHYLLNRRMLVKRLSFKTGSIQDAEDVVQEAYCRALKYITSFNKEQSFENWFSRILRNSIKEWEREKFNNPPTESLEEEALPPIPDSNIQKRLLKSVEESIEEEKNEYIKEILKLYYIQGFKLAEIVQITNGNYTAVNNMVHRFKRGIKCK